MGYIFHLGFSYRQGLCFVFAFVDRLFAFSIWAISSGWGKHLTFSVVCNWSARDWPKSIGGVGGGCKGWVVQFSATPCKTQPAGIIASSETQGQSVGSSYCLFDFASYPDVSFLMKLCAQRKAGGRQRARRASSAVSTLPMVPCRSSPVTCFALVSAMRETQRLRRRLYLTFSSPPHLYLLIK